MFCLFVLFCFFNEQTEVQPATPNKCSEVKFYLAAKVLFRVFEGRSFPAPSPSPPLKKIFLSLQYISNSIGKTIQTRRVQCTHCNISQNCVSKCARLHLSAYLLKKKFPGRTCLRTPLGNLWPSVTRDFSPKR